LLYTAVREKHSATTFRWKYELHDLCAIFNGIETNMRTELFRRRAFSMNFQGCASDEIPRRA
jgi:hypothetical protein